MKKRWILSALLFTAFLLSAAISISESFLVVSDTHLTKEVAEYETMLKAVVQAAQGKDAVLLLGDNTNNTHAEEHRRVLQWIHEIEHQTKATVYVIPGNHDYTAHYGPEEFTSQYRNYGWGQAFSQDTGSAGYAVMTRNGICLLMLDTNLFNQAYSIPPYGGVEGSTLKWIQEVLEDLPEGTPVIACGHHPILPWERDERTPGAYALSQVLRAYGVGLYLCGHDHGFATVEQNGLRQITIGQPQAYPGWAGIVEPGEDSFLWHTEQLYGEHSPAFSKLREDTYSLGCRMARGTLESTPYADDEDAVEWFTSTFMLFAGCDMTPESNGRLLADENCRKWRLAETSTVVKDWILGLLENTPESVRNITIPVSRKHSLKLPVSF